MGIVRLFAGEASGDLEIDITVRARRNEEVGREEGGGRRELPLLPEEHLGRDGEWW